jgi:hypothetical protein
MKKELRSKHQPHEPHMVGDGLPVRNFFSYGDLGKHELSPFLMLDYGSPSQFPPTDKLLGVGMHPHRGFETVTLVFQGGLSHRDTAGNAGDIGAGDVQWMTAGSGVLHEELHSASFRKTGGTLQMLQLWVNLPSDLKMTTPRYQSLSNAEIPVVKAQGAAIRVIAGSYGDVTGPAKTFTPINLWDVRLEAGGKLSLDVPENYTTALVELEGSSTINGADSVHDEALVILDRKGTTFEIESKNGAHVIVLNGEPIAGPVVGHGPFVMNTEEQIVEAINDLRRGRFGAITAGGK